jgi:hypothetical protein
MSTASKRQKTAPESEDEQQPFPNLGVSLKFLLKIRNDPRLQIPMCELLGLDVEARSASELRSLAKSVRALSHLEGTVEFASYEDPSHPREFWLEALQKPPTTTTQ